MIYPKKKGYTCCLTLTDVGGLAQYQQTACVTLLRKRRQASCGSSYHKNKSGLKSALVTSPWVASSIAKASLGDALRLPLINRLNHVRDMPKWVAISLFAPRGSSLK